MTLLQKLSYCRPQLKPYRGYALQQNNNIECSNIKIATGDKKQVWYIYTGMGCQWKGMGHQLMKIETFARSFMKCAEIIKPYGLDLLETISPDNSVMVADRMLAPSGTAITAIQIALTDVLTELGIRPDGIIGHSTGEVAASYADGCTTLEETILISYLRGEKAQTSNLIHGAMAAVGMSWKQAEDLCPETVFPACHNSDDSVTISGPHEDVENFVKQLKEQDIFAKIVDSCGYSFHTKYVKPAAEAFAKNFSNIIKNPKPRSSRWISTCFKENELDNPDCKAAGVNYFKQNIVSPVLFNEATKKIPPNAILIEIGPHHLLQAILKRSVGPDAVNVGLMKRNAPDNVMFFLEAIGKLYMEGVDPRVERLYPPVKFPVPRKTPSISDLIKWNHSGSFKVLKWHPKNKEISQSYDLYGEDSYLLDHCIDGRSLFPATGYIVFAWKMLAKILQKKSNELPVFIENFKIHRAIVLNPNNTLKLNFNLLNDSKHFEIFEGSSMAASGQIYEWKNGTFVEPDPVYSSNINLTVQGADIYNELKITGYEYGPEFQGLLEMNLDGTQGLVLWKNRWTPFLDSMLLFCGFITNSGQFYLPTGALSIKLDPKALTENLMNDLNFQGVPVNYDPDTRICRSVGVEITNLAADIAPHRVKEVHPVLEEYRFVPYVSQYIPNKESDEELFQYMHICNEIMDTIGQKMGIKINGEKFKLHGSNGTKIEIDLTKFNGNEYLIKCLNGISELARAPKSELKALCSSYFKEIGKDFLNIAITKGYALKIMLEIIAENTFKKLNVAEIHNSETTIITPNINMMVQKFPNIRCKNITLITHNKSMVDHVVTENNNIQLRTKDAITKLSVEKSQDVAVGSFINGSVSDLRQLIETLSSIVQEAGFILFYHKEKLTSAEELIHSFCEEGTQIQSRSTLENIVCENKLIIVSKICDIYGSAMYLLRQNAPKSHCKVINVANNPSMDWVEELKSNLARNDEDLLWLVSENDETNGLIGMVNCLKQEPGGERIRCVFISNENGKTKPPPFSFAQDFYKPLLSKNLMINVLKDDLWGSFRHILMRDTKIPRKVEHSYVNCKKYGDLSSFEWVESQVQYSDMSSKMLVHIYYSAMNFKDVMLATGKLSVGAAKTGTDSCSDGAIFGLEYSGRDKTGRRVAGMTPNRGMATTIVVDPMLSIDVPDNWSLEEAATVPVVYSTCYYALVMRANIRHGESILIHSATGGIGIAAIHIALSYNCEIFATVGNEDKRNYLRKLFPQIKDENIGCSRDIQFENMIMKRTKGRGVDVVLNSLADDKFQASVRCVAKHGNFVEIGKYDLSLDRNLGLKTFLKNITFHAVMLDELFENTPKSRGEFRRVIELVKNGIKTGVVKPLVRTVFEREEIEKAFRYMGKGVHIGKVVLKIRDEESEKKLLPKALSLHAIPNTYFYPNKVYIIVGGLGGFGIEVTKWILQKGAKNVIMTSRCGAQNPYHKMCLRRWKKAGYNVQLSLLNAAIPNEAEQLIQEALQIGPVGGIFNSAVVLKDGFIDCQSPETFKISCTPKATATKILDKLSRHLCPSLDYFVCFSSLSCGKGNAGQTNYGYANSVMERICEQRRNAGLHGLAIQWGIIGNVGLVHRHMGDDAMIAGVRAQNIKSCLDVLDLFCQSSCPVVGSYVTAVPSQKVSKKLDIISQIAKVLGMTEISEVFANRPFGEMGIDSLMGIEIKQLLESQADISLTSQELLELKINDIKELVKNSSENTAVKSQENRISVGHFTLPSELLNKESVVSLNSVKNGTPVFILNIGNTDVTHFKVLADNIGVPLFALLRTKSTPINDMETLTKWFLEVIKSKTTGAFNLIGYSFSGCVAFNMAIKEESNNLKSIMLLDGSTHLIKYMNGNSDPNKSEVLSLCDFVEQFSSEPVTEIEDELLKSTSLDKRIKIVSDILSSSSQTINKTELNVAITEHLRLSKLLQSYSSSKKLSKAILLVEDPLKILSNDVSEIKSFMNQLCSGKVAIHRLLSLRDLCNKDMVKGLIEICNEMF